MEYQLPNIGSIYIQDYDYSCGPCCILNILNLKGLHGKYSEEEVISFCNANEKTGTSPEGLKKGLKKAGLTIIEEKENASIDDIRRHLTEKHFVIVNFFHRYADEGHFGVIIDTDQTGLYLVDSSLGLLRLDINNFEKYWHNNDSTQLHYMIAVS